MDHSFHVVTKFVTKPKIIYIFVLYELYSLLYILVCDPFWVNCPERCNICVLIHIFACGCPASALLVEVFFFFFFFAPLSCFCSFISYEVVCMYFFTYLHVFMIAYLNSFSTMYNILFYVLILSYEHWSRYPVYSHIDWIFLIWNFEQYILQCIQYILNNVFRSSGSLMSLKSDFLPACS